MSEPAWWAEARNLVGEGLTRREAAKRLGVSYESVRKAFMDPAKYAANVQKWNARSAPCADCGKPHRLRVGENSTGRCGECHRKAAFAPRHERALLMQRLWQQGKKLREIGAVVGWDLTAVNSEIGALRKLGYEFPLRWDKSPETQAQIEALLAAGRSYQQVAAETGLSIGTLRQRMNYRYGTSRLDLIFAEQVAA